MAAVIKDKALILSGLGLFIFYQYKKLPQLRVKLVGGR